MTGPSSLFWRLVAAGLLLAVLWLGHLMGDTRDRLARVEGGDLEWVTRCDDDGCTTRLVDP